MKVLRRRSKRKRDERGLTLVETMIAAAILMIVVTSILSLFTLAVSTNQQQGNLATRTTEYAQDKMEQLVALNFTDTTADTTVLPVCINPHPPPCAGTGLGPATLTNGTPVGSIPTVAAVAGYVDYLDDTGNLLPTSQGSTGSSYSRQWQISIDATGTIKTITVVATSYVPGIQQGLPPSTIVVCQKSSGL